MTIASRGRAVAGLVLAGLALSSCAPPVSVEEAPLAADPACAEILVGVPEAIDDQERRWTDSQGTAAWGDPAAVLFACGFPDSDPGSLPCETVAGIDWIVNAQGEGRYLLTTFGRSPAIRLYVDSTRIPTAEAAEALSPAIGTLPASRSCPPSIGG